MTLKAIRKFIRRLRRSSFVRNVAVLATGSAIAQVIPIIALPIISRLYEPKDFGVAALFLSFSTIIGISATLRYDHAIVLPKDSRTANQLATISIALAVIISGFLLALVVTGKWLHLEPAWLSQFGLWVYFLPLGVLLVALENTALGIATREKRFRKIAGAAVIHSSTVSGIRVVSGFFNSGIAGLIGSLLTGLIAKLAFLWHPQRTSRHLQLGSPKETRSLMYHYRQFPHYSLPTGLLRALNQNLPIFALAFIFSPAIVGFYAMGNRLLKMPVQLFTESVRRIYLQEAAELINHGKPLKRPLLKATGGLAILGLMIFAPIILLGDQLFTFVLGGKWTNAGVFAQILAPFLFLLFIQGPSGATFVVLQKQHVLMKIQLVAILLTTGVFLASSAYGLEVKTTLAFFSAASSMMSIIVIAVAISISTSHITNDPK